MCHKSLVEQSLYETAPVKQQNSVNKDGVTMSN
jgi:hypothetical protein